MRHTFFMIQTTSTKPKVVEVADQILADIKTRKLSAGDAYLTTADAAKKLKVGTQTANRAMQLLVQQGVLKRSHKAGCVIAGDATEPAVLSRVHILVNRDHMRTEGLLADGLIVGLQRELAGAQVLFNFLPQHGEDAFVRDVIAEALRQPDRSGFILARSGFELQKLVAESGLAAVVLGTPYRAVHGLASLDRDHREAGRLLARNLLDRGCQRMIVLMRGSEWPGDFAFLDAILHALAVAGISPDRLSIRHLPPEQEAIAAEMAYLLAEDEAATGVIARSEPLAMGALAAVERLGKPQRVMVAVSDVYRGVESKPPRMMHIRAMWSAEQIGAQLGKMLRQQAMGERVNVLHEVIPVMEGRGI